MKIWAIYKKEDAVRNEKFINYLSSSCLEKGISFELIYLENLVLGVINNKLEIIPTIVASLPCASLTFGLLVSL